MAFFKFFNLSTLAITLVLQAVQCGVASPIVKRGDRYDDIHFEVVLRPRIEQSQQGVTFPHIEATTEGRWIGLTLPSQFSNAIWLGSRHSWPRDHQDVTIDSQPMDGNLSAVFHFRKQSDLPIASWNLYAAASSATGFKPIISMPCNDGEACFWVNGNDTALVLIGFDFDQKDIGRSPEFTLAQLYPTRKAEQSRQSLTLDMKAQMNLLSLPVLAFVLWLLVRQFQLWMRGTSNTEEEDYECAEKSFGRLSL